MPVASEQREKTEHEADGGIEKRICVKHQDPIDDGRRTQARDDEDVYVVHGGRIICPGAIDRLRSNAVVHVVDKMRGGGKKRRRRRKWRRTKVHRRWMWPSR